MSILSATDAAFDAVIPEVLATFLERWGIKDYTHYNGLTIFGNAWSKYDVQVKGGEQGIETIALYGMQTGYEADLTGKTVRWGTRKPAGKLGQEFRIVAQTLHYLRSRSK